MPSAAGGGRGGEAGVSGTIEVDYPEWGCRLAKPWIRLSREAQVDGGKDRGVGMIMGPMPPVEVQWIGNSGIVMPTFRPNRPSKLPRPQDAVAEVRRRERRVDVPRLWRRQCWRCGVETSSVLRVRLTGVGVLH